MMGPALRKCLVAALLLIVAGCLWEAGYRIKWIDPIIFSAPSMIYRAALSDGELFRQATIQTAYEVFVSILVSWPLGIYLGAVIGRSAFGSRVAMPIFSALIAIPLVVLYPLFVTSFGIGAGSKIAFAIVLGVFPIASNTTVGMRSFDPGYAKAALAMGASRRQILFRVMIPMAVPHIFNGLRLGTSLIIAGVVLAEMLAATDGLGFLISYNRALFNSGQVYLGVGLTLIIAIVANGLLVFCERFMTPQASSAWKAPRESNLQLAV